MRKRLASSFDLHRVFQKIRVVMIYKNVDLSMIFGSIGRFWLQENGHSRLVLSGFVLLLGKIPPWKFFLQKNYRRLLGQ